jgi:hypothetical protein
MPSSSVPWSIGRFMAFFVFKLVRISPLNSSYSVDRDPLTDVYIYNFPDDRRALKFLGEYLTIVG